MPRAEDTAPLAVRLQQAIDDAGETVRSLAALLAADSGRTPESERRALNKYLHEGTQPSRQTARRLAAKLGKPADYFVTPRASTKPGSPEDLAALRAEIAELRRLVDDLREQP